MEVSWHDQWDKVFMPRGTAYEDDMKELIKSGRARVSLKIIDSQRSVILSAAKDLCNLPVSHSA
jgi:hypothetical protein